MNSMHHFALVSILTITAFITSLFGVSLFSTPSYQKNVLLIGRDGSEERNGERADAIILCNVNKKNNLITLISIPRDSRVLIPCGPSGNIYDKISHSLYYGSKNEKNGETCVAKTVKKMFNLSSLPYISINFRGIRDVVNKIGGVEILSPFSFCQQGRDGKNYCFSKNTKTKVSGDSFLAFVRHRKTFIRGDFDRTYNQRVALTALFNKIKNSSNFKKIKLGVYSLTKVRSNIKVSTIYAYSRLNISNYKVDSLMLKGNDINGSIYYYQVDEKHLLTLSQYLNGN